MNSMNAYHSIWQFAFFEIFCERGFYNLITTHTDKKSMNNIFAIRVIMICKLFENIFF